MLAEQSDFDVVIVGLGPVGAVAANLAGSLGLKTLVLERTDHAYLKPRAIVFDAEIMRIFDSIGLSARIFQGLTRARRVHLSRRGPAAHSNLSCSPTSSPAGVACQQLILPAGARVHSSGRLEQVQ